MHRALTSPLRTLLLLLLAALVAALVAALCWHALRDPPAPTQTSPTEDGEPADPVAGMAAAQASDAQTRAARVPVPTAPPPPLSPPAAQATPLLLRVIEALTLAPVADAEVHWVNHDWIPQEDLEPLMRERGQRLVTDARGEGRIQRAHPTVWACARVLGRYGEAHCSELATRELVIEIEKDVTFAVRVRDATGSPCEGVRVVVKGHPSDPQRPGHLARRETAKGTGLARFVHVQTTWHQRNGHGDAPAELVASISLPGLALASTPFPPAAPPSDPIDLVLPASGAVVITVEEASGKQLRAEAWVMLRAAEADRNDIKVFIARDGEARYPHVALGKRYVVSAEGNGASWPELTFDGPTLAGETVTARLARASPLPLLVGRALDAEGKPLPREVLTLALCYAPGARFDDTFRTDPEGRFRLVAPAAAEGRAIERLTVVRHDATLWRMARSFPLAAGENDLGDLRCVAAPLIVGGVVVDEDGAPVEGATVGVQMSAVVAALAPGKEPHALKLSDCDLWLPRCPGGRFEVRGFPPGAELVLLASHKSYVRPAPLPFTRGAADLRVVLQRAATLRLDVLLDREVDERDLWFRLTGPDGGARTAENTDGKQGDRLGLSWTGLARDRYELRAGTAGDDEPLRVLREIAVGPEDARVTLDLRGALRTLRVRAVDAQGQRIAKPGAVRVAHDAGPGSRFRHVAMVQGEALLRTGRPAVDLAITMPGYAMKLVIGAARDIDVVLDEPVLVTLLVEGLAPLELQRLVAFLAPKPLEGSPDAWSLDQAAELGIVARGRREGDTTAFPFRLGASGEHEVLLFSREDLDHPRSVEPGTITVRAREGTQVFTVRAR